ncbi:MAG: hypothetical protein H0V53_06340 [Rubrobacter sp.]|nr:hypothetical protein [Rubrobacter sp.]
MGQDRNDNPGNSNGGGEEGQAKQQSREVAQQAENQVSHYTEEGLQRVKGQLATQKERAAGELDGISRALQSAGDQLREQEQGSIGRYADQAAEQTERLSGYLNERDADQLISEAEDLARHQPAVFLGAAFALGAVAARFLKSSSRGSGGSGGGTREEAVRG